MFYFSSILFISTILLFIFEKKKREVSYRNSIFLILGKIGFSFLLEWICYLDFSPFSHIKLSIFSFLIVDCIYLWSMFRGKKNIFTFFLHVFTIFLFVEIFFFNFRHFESLHYEERELSNFIIQNGDKKGEHTFSFSKTDQKKQTSFSLEIPEIYEKIENIYIDAYLLHNPSKKLEVTLHVTDEANEYYYALPSRTLVPSVWESKYMRLHTSGNTEKIKISFSTGSTEKNAIIHVNSIKINSKVPLHLWFIRPFFLTSFLTFLYLIWPTSIFWNLVLNFKEKKQKWFIVGVLGLEILYLTGTVFLNPTWLVNKKQNAQLEYHKLAIALKKGHFYLEDVVPEQLKEMKNPYDITARRKVFTTPDTIYLWDYAYYDSKYYVYFGIVPALFVYLPASYLFGDFGFPNFLYIYVMGILFVFVSYFLLKEVCMRYFEKIPILLFLLLWLFIINASQLPYIMHRPTFYSVPIITALLLTTLGLFLWLSSTREGKLNKKRMVFGSLCMALVAGSRPQFLLGSFFCFPIFYSTYKRKEILTKKSLKETIFFCLPYVIVALFLMYYNYARFGSIFDFGANYNLTTNDMTKRGFVLERIPLGIYTYLFEPLHTTLQFPFMEPSVIKTTYLGRTISENFLGGAVRVHVLLILSFFVFWFRNYFKNKRLYITALMATIFAVLILIMDTEMAGILPRYLTDFIWLLLISTTLILLAIYSTIKEENVKYMLRGFVTFGTTLTLVYSFFLSFVDITYSLCNTNPYIFYKIYHMFMFLM